MTYSLCNPFPPKKNIQLIGVLIVEWNLLQQVRVFLQLNYALNILPPLSFHISLFLSLFFGGMRKLVCQREAGASYTRSS